MSKHIVTGNGADQTDELQRAIDSAGPNGVVTIEGTILIMGPLLRGTDVTIESDGGLVSMKDATIGDLRAS